MNARPMFDPRMLDRLSGFYPSKVDIIGYTTEPDEMGSPVTTPFTVLEGIDAQIAPFNDIIPISGERKLENLNYNTQTFRIALKGYFPTIDTKMTVKFLEDATEYNILGVEFDSHHMTTRLIVNVVLI